MKKAIYPCWMDVPCSECGKILKVFCYNSKNFKRNRHFCEDSPCLENYYNKTLSGTSAKSTISRLITMRDYRNKQIKEYHEKLDESWISELEKDLIKPSPSEGFKKEIHQRDQEYIRQLKLQKGIKS